MVSRRATKVASSHAQAAQARRHSKVTPHPNAHPTWVQNNTPALEGESTSAFNISERGDAKPHRAGGVN
eukprot:12181034-Alexandrium_andersonii.AAC.1